MFKSIAAGAAALFLSTTFASAAPVTVYFQVNNITATDGTFDALGMSLSALSGSVTYDDDYSVGPRSVATSDYEFDYGRQTVLSYTWDFGGFSFNDNSPSVTSDDVYVRDGLANGDRTINDYWRHMVRGIFDGIGGATGSQAYVFGMDRDLDTFDDLTPTADEIAGLDTLGFRSQFFVGDARYRLMSDDVTFSSVAPVPLPATGLLLMAAVGGLAAMRRGA